jgi:5,10-methenyltetrahydromethanopterin hydrogenase
MSDLLEALNNKIKGLGAPLQEVVDSLPCLSKDSLTEAEAEEAIAALAPHIGKDSFVMDSIRAKVGKVEKILKKFKPKKKTKLEVVPESDED